jgi:hypothetical protein
MNKYVIIHVKGLLEKNRLFAQYYIRSYQTEKLTTNQDVQKSKTVGHGLQLNTQPK